MFVFLFFLFLRHALPVLWPEDVTRYVLSYASEE